MRAEILKDCRLPRPGALVWDPAANYPVGEQAMSGPFRQAEVLPSFDRGGQIAGLRRLDVTLGR